MQRLLVWFFFLLSLFLLWWTYTSVEYEVTEQNLTQSLEAKISKNYLDVQILAAIKEENFDDVLLYQNLAELLHKELLPSTLAQIEAHNGALETSWRNIKEFTSGFVSGTSGSALGMSGSIASDLTLYGDIRDLKTEGTKYIEGEPYDAFILNISMVGIGLSVSQLLTVGVSTPLKVGASVLKVAKKTGRLTKPFTKVLSSKLSKTIDTKLLKTLNLNSVLSLDKTSQTIAKSIDIKPVKSLFKDVNLIKENTSMVDTISLMKYVDTHKDLKSIGKISSSYKANTKGILRVLGKSALRTGKSVIKFTTKLLWTLVGLVSSLLVFLTLLVMKYRGYKKFKDTVF